MVSIVCICIGILLFTVYNSVAVSLFGFPWSMSETYYLYEKQKQGLGWLFTIFMWALAFIMLPSWLTVSDSIGGWRSNLTFLAFISAASMLFIGAAPRYKASFESTVHTVAALICAITALLWDFLVCWNVWYITLIGMVIPTIIATVTKTWKSSRDFWLEMMAFGGTFSALLSESILIYVK